MFVIKSVYFFHFYMLYCSFLLFEASLLLHISESKVCKIELFPSQAKKESNSITTFHDLIVESFYFIFELYLVVIFYSIFSKRWFL